MYRKNGHLRGLMVGFLMVVSAVLIFFLFKGTIISSGRLAKEVVEGFYRFEQAGEFSKSWALFHPLMKEKFTKGHYIQDRAHVFMNHFGVETFTYTIGKPDKMNDWKMSKAGPALKNVYKVQVTQNYKGKYGNFHLQAGCLCH